MNVNMNDLRIAFAYKDSRELRYTWMIYGLISKPFLVKMLKGLTGFALKYRLPVTPLIKNTVFKVFCAGESKAEAFRTIRKLHKFQVKSVLDYVAEAEKSAAAFEANASGIIDNIRMSGEDGTKCDFISIKLSGLEDPDYLTSASETQNYDSDMRYHALAERLRKICTEATVNNVMVYLDAEESWMQHVIDRLAEELMKEFNTQRVIVFNTLQMYRTDRIDYLNRALARAEKAGYKAGIKLVRGAYHEKEIQAAMQANRPIPVFLTQKETNMAFNEAIDICLSAHDRVCTCIASHNQASILYTLSAIGRYGIRDHHDRVQFSQLFGMSDNITFNLASKGYNASKYLPYGEVGKAIPYLMRRAEENTSLNGQMAREFSLLSREVKRRDHEHA